MVRGGRGGGEESRAAWFSLMLCRYRMPSWLVGLRDVPGSLKERPAMSGVGCIIVW